ncbi:MAG TPA: hypothetical protein VMM76_20480 [Pirellulaceae bacterium]|nr:hypothetical protein [Pirellulaceae bacterium]
MKPSEMLHQMCHSLLAATDIKELCRARGFAAEALKSPGILETLFLSPQGVSEVLASLEPGELAALHLLRSVDGPVDVSFFARVYGKRNLRGTFSQRFQSVFSEVKQRLIRRGVLLWSEERQRLFKKESKLELTRLQLPVEFYNHLPPLIPAAREFSGAGNWNANVASDKLIEDLGNSSNATKERLVCVEDGELRISGKPFTSATMTRWQQNGWAEAAKQPKQFTYEASKSKQPDEAMIAILSELDDHAWADVEQLAEPLRIFCDTTVDAAAVCEAGWKWGLLERRREEDKTWYRLVSPQDRVAVHRYLIPNEQDDCVTVDLRAVPLAALEQIVAISNQRVSPGGNGSLLITPNFVKLGRADDELLASEPVQWLVEHTKPFAEMYVLLSERRGQTILHEDVALARVSDLSLKVAIEKALGQNVVLLKNDFIAFPRGRWAEVQRVVKKSGHVVKEIVAK